jgi:Flp pilus assembly protein TadD
MHRAARTRASAAILLTALLLLGCTSLRGAQAYRDGNRSLERGDASQAVLDFERAARLLPEQSEVHNHLGMALAETGRLDEALQQFERATALDCDNRAAEHNLAKLRRERERGPAGPAGQQAEEAP